jgi:kinesin family protein 5
VKELDFTLDRVMSDAPQTEVYEQVNASIEDVLKGFNATIFAYGQTGSGKSHTMFGDLKSEDLRGIIPRACQHIFSHIANDESGSEWQIKSSFLEIYMENVKDLLGAGGGNLKVRETPAKGVWVEGLSEEFVTNEEEVLDLLRRGEKQRSTSATGMNETSSRSHSLFVLTVIQRLKDGSTITGKLNLGDLAGSERIGKTGATGTTLEEAKKINQSLSALGNCINALTKEGARGHIPYRDSKLTFILRESLGGNTKTTLIVAASPHSFNVDETISTLRFAQRAKNITNSVSVNQKRSVEELELIVKALMAEIGDLKKKLGMGGGGGSGGPQSPTSGSSLDQISANLKNKEEESEKLLLLEYEISKLKTDLADAKTELTAAKANEEVFETAKKKWEYDEQQLKLQLESENMLAASSAEKVNKVMAEKEALALQIDELQGELADVQQSHSQKQRALAEQLEQKQEKLSAIEDKYEKQASVLEEKASLLETLKSEKEKADKQNKDLETTISEFKVLKKEQALVEEALRRDLEDKNMDNDNRNDELSKIRAEVLALAKNANVADAKIESLTTSLKEMEDKYNLAVKELEDSKNQKNEIEGMLTVISFWV